MRYAECTVRNHPRHSTKRCEKCHHYVAHHFNYRYCQECDEHDAQYSDGSYCDRKTPTNSKELGANK